MTDCHLCWIMEDIEMDTFKFNPAELKAKPMAVKKKRLADALQVKRLNLRIDSSVSVVPLESIEEGKSEEVERVEDDREKVSMKEFDNADDGVNRSCYTLEGVTFSVKKGQLIAVVGPVGSGKSSLLSGLLGEMNLQEGKVRVAGSVAYCDQRPWILNTTVKENILFGLDYDEVRFDRTLHAASLEDDMKVLPGGVLTEIGEGRGMRDGLHHSQRHRRCLSIRSDDHYITNQLH
jgi:ABC-type multidrug transport system fused ATPase/permease subunit